MTGLIDGDIVAYRAAASCEKRDKEGNLISLEPEEIALLRADNTMMDILHSEEDHITFLTGKNNFRYTINPEYKANRRGKPKPEYLQAIRDYLVQEYKTVITDGIEADDALGIHQTENSIIYSIDKDLLMIPGHHFNFVTKEYLEVSELDGIRAFYRQMLIGDTSDNIFGVKGIGKVRAAKLINHLEDEDEMYNTVFDLYMHPTCPLIDDEERFNMNANCLWIQRKEGELFTDRYVHK